MKNLFDYVLTVNNFLSPDTCSDIIKGLNEIPFDRNDFYNSVTNTIRDQGDEELFISYSENISKPIWDRIPYALTRYAFKARTPYVNFRERSQKHYSKIKFNKYPVGTKMREHVDHIHSLFEGERKGIPVLTLLGFLNDDYDGGDFYLCDQRLEVSAGQLLIFPSIFLYPHRVEPITKGTRYSWVSWVW